MCKRSDRPDAHSSSASIKRYVVGREVSLSWVNLVIFNNAGIAIYIDSTDPFVVFSAC